MNKNGLPSASAQLEDLTGGIEVLFFPQTYFGLRGEITDDAVVYVKAKVAARDDRIALIAHDLWCRTLQCSDGPAARGEPADAAVHRRQGHRVEQVLARHPGTSQVHLRLISGERYHHAGVGCVAAVTPSSALMGDLKALLGPGCLG